MKLKRYYVIGDTLRDAVWCYNYMLNLLHDHIRWTDRTWKIIDIDEYRLIFTSADLYMSHQRHGNRAETISCYGVERQLDRYRTLKGE